MRLVTFAAQGKISFGVLSGDSILDLQEAFRLSGGPVVRTMEDFLQMGEQGMSSAAALARDSRTEPGRALVSRSAARILAPVLKPSKIVAIGLNYMDHCREQKVEPPKVPITFTKFPSSITGPDAVISWDGSLTAKVDFEAELGVVIGTTARRVPREDALRYVAGYTALNDVSARDLQFSDGQWVRGKSLDTFCPMGPALVTRDEIPDPQRLAIRCTINGKTYQDSTTAEMIFSVAELIEFLTRGITLEPGDVIATGTPHGVGVFRKPAVYLQHEDEVVVEIEGIGQLCNRCDVR